MINLKEQEAIDYLGRIKSTIPPEYQFSNLPLLSKLIELETLFLQRNLDRGNAQLAVITIDATGFPELPSWKVDLRSLSQEFESIKSNRAQGLLPFLAQLKNGSPSHALEAGSRFTKQLETDRPLVQAFEDIGLGWIQTYLKDNNLPFHKKETLPGLLFGRLFGSGDHNNTGQILERQDGKTIYHIGEQIAFKFIDGNTLTNQSERRPTFIYVETSTDNRILYLGALPPKDGLIRRLKGKGAAFITGELESINLNSSYQILKVNNRELSFTEAEQPILRALVNFSSNGLSDQEINQFIQSLYSLNRLVKFSRQFVNQALNGNDIAPLSSENSIARISKGVGSIFNSIKNDELRRSAQLAWAECLEPTVKQAQEISGLPQIELKKVVSTKDQQKQEIEQLRKQSLAKIREVKERVKHEPKPNFNTPEELQKASESSYQLISELAGQSVIDYLVISQKDIIFEEKLMGFLVKYEVCRISHHTKVLSWVDNGSNFHYPINFTDSKDYHSAVVKKGLASLSKQEIVRSFERAFN